MTRKALVLVWFALLVQATTVRYGQADELSELKRQVWEQNERLKVLQGRLDEYEARHQQNNQILAQHISASFNPVSCIMDSRLV